jgi:hypothetical protein
MRMNTKAKRWRELYTVVFVIIFIYAHQTGLWTRNRWTGLALGGAWTLVFLLFPRDQDRDVRLGMRVALFFFLIGLLGVIDFVEGGSSSDGCMALIFLGFAVRELYLHRKFKNVSSPPQIAVS